MEFALRPERSVPSIGFFNVYLSAQEFENTQATAVFNFNQYTFTSMKQLMDGAWARVPAHNPHQLPPGRPHWEPSVALCDKGDGYDSGFTIPNGELKFVARRSNVGQDHVLDDVVEVFHAGELGLTDARRPKGSFLFLGPTGVGKTETALVATEYLMGSDKLARIDMSEFQLQESLPALIGRDRNDQGLLGQRFHEIGGQGTLLLDEIEKADPRILDLLLQLLDAARVTLSDGTTLDFCRCYVVLTSNIAGVAIIDTSASTRSTRERFIKLEAQRALRPETFARISRECVFEALGWDEQRQIVNMMVQREVERLRTLGYEVTVSDGVCHELLRVGVDRRLGVRPLRDVVERQLMREIVCQVK